MTAQRLAKTAIFPPEAPCHEDMLKAYQHTQALKAKTFDCYTQANHCFQQGFTLNPEHIGLLVGWAKCLMEAHALYRFENEKTYANLRSLGARMHVKAYQHGSEEALEAWSELPLAEPLGSAAELILTFEDILRHLQTAPPTDCEGWLNTARSLHGLASALYTRWEEALRETLLAFEHHVTELSTSPKAQAEWGDLWCEQALHVPANQSSICFEYAFAHYYSLYQLAPAAFYGRLGPKSFQAPTEALLYGDAEVRCRYAQTYYRWRQTFQGEWESFRYLGVFANA